MNKTSNEAASFPWSFRIGTVQGFLSGPGVWVAVIPAQYDVNKPIVSREDRLKAGRLVAALNSGREADWRGSVQMHGLAAFGSDGVQTT